MKYDIHYDFDDNTHATHIQVFRFTIMQCTRRTAFEVINSCKCMTVQLMYVHETVEIDSYF